MSDWINGNLIGSLSVGQGERGKSIEYMWRGTELGIRQEGEEEYQFVDLAGGGVGTNGKEVELQVGNGYIQWRYKGDAEWKNLIAIADLKGEQGIQGVPGANGNDGRDGENGKSLEFEWRGTELGVKREDSQDFQYTNLKGVDGTNGTDGKDGKDGITPNLTVGNVETLEPTSDVTVTIGGTKENPILNFGIPKGDRGKDGIVGKDGKSLEFNWNDTSLGIRKEGDSDYQYVNLEGKQGQPGIAGTDGRDGITPNIKIGNVVSVESSEPPSVTIRGDKENPILDFNIPKGVQGIQGVNGQDGTNGENGKSLEYNWNGTQLGVKREDENSYNYVDLKGRDGQEGQKGADGRDGITPNIQIGTVSTLEPGTNATVTKDGTTENPIFNFGIPKGIKGDKGVYVGSKDSAPPTADIVIDNSDNGLYVDKLVVTPIVGGTLNLTLNKYQTTTMENNTTIVLPSVDKLAEIHLFFSTTEELTLTLPNIKWQNQPTIEANKTYEFIFTYTTEWLGGVISYNE